MSGPPDSPDDTHGTGGIATERARPKLLPPRRYQVILLNDDYTPMDFVVHVLEYFFTMPHERAVQVMLMIHHQGKAVCGVYTHEVAETKVAQVNAHARRHDHPLMCVMEQA